MNKTIKRTIIAVLLLCVALAFACFAACGGNTPDIPDTPPQQGQTGTGENNGEQSGAEVVLSGTDIKTQNLTVDGTNLSYTVSNATATYSMINEITVADGASWKLYPDIGCTTEVVSKTVALNEGDNLVYVLVTNGTDIKLYTATLRRRPMYTVTFNTNGGSLVDSQIIEEDSCITVPITTRVGYNIEWDFDFNNPITKDMTINASWKANIDTAYQVEYYLQNLEDDGYTLETTENKTGTTDTTATAEIKPFAHFTYKPSTTESGNIAPDGSTILKVYYTRDKYTVTFDGNCGTLKAGNATQTVKYGGSVDAPIYERIGYTFNNFDKSLENITETQIITASWVANGDTVYKVNYYLQNLYNDYYALETTESKTGTTDTTANAKIKKFDHFTYTPSETESGNIDGNGSTVLKVYYTRDKYTVTFDANDGTLKSGNATQIVKYGGSVVAPTYERTGYTFINFDKSLENISETQTIKAQWKINQYTLTIVYNNGQKDNKITQNYDTAIASEVNPSRIGYTFKGWDKTIPTKMPAEDLTITAQWRINQYTLTIVYGNGQQNKTITQDYNTSIASEANPSRVGFTFNGWDKIIPTKMPAKNITITAQWRINQYTLTIVYGNGQQNKTITQDYNTTIESEANPSRDGYTFNGWDNAIPTKMPADDIIITAQWLAIFTLDGGTITGLTSYGKTLSVVIIPSKIDNLEVTIIGEYGIKYFSFAG